MDTASALIGLVLIAVCALPFILMGRGRKKTEKRLLATLQSLASEHHTAIGEHDFGTQIAVGLSTDGQHVFFTKQADGKEAVTQHIALQLVERGIANSITRSVSHGKGSETVIDRLELDFQLKDSKAAVQKLVFFNSDDNIHMDNELELLRKWEKRLNVLLMENKS